MKAERTVIGGKVYYTVWFAGDEIVFDTKEDADQFIAEQEG